MIRQAKALPGVAGLSEKRFAGCVARSFLSSNRASNASFTWFAPPGSTHLVETVCNRRGAAFFIFCDESSEPPLFEARSAADRVLSVAPTLFEAKRAAKAQCRKVDLANDPTEPEPRYRPKKNPRMWRRWKCLDKLAERHRRLEIPFDAFGWTCAVWDCADFVRPDNRDALAAEKLQDLGLDVDSALLARAADKVLRMRAWQEKTCGRWHPLSGKTVAEMTGCTALDRRLLDIRTIGAVDETDEQARIRRTQSHNAAQRRYRRRQRPRPQHGSMHPDGTSSTNFTKLSSRERDAARKRAERAAKGAIPRAVYEAQSFSATRPWESLSIGRRAWEKRRQKNGQGQGRGAQASRAVAGGRHWTLGMGKAPQGVAEDRPIANSSAENCSHAVRITQTHYRNFRNFSQVCPEGRQGEPPRGSQVRLEGKQGDLHRVLYSASPSTTLPASTAPAPMPPQHGTISPYDGIVPGIAQQPARPAELLIPPSRDTAAALPPGLPLVVSLDDGVSPSPSLTISVQCDAVGASLDDTATSVRAQPPADVGAVADPPALLAEFCEATS
jgi:hypothetical protein